MTLFPVAHTRAILVGALLLTSSMLAACGSTDTPTAPVAAPTDTTAPAGGGGAATATTAPSTGGSTSGSQPIAVTLNEWSIQPAAITVPAGHQVFKVTNAGKFSHNFAVVVNGQTMKTPNLKTGESATLETDLTAGKYDSLCAIPGHKERGMAGTVTVQ